MIAAAIREHGDPELSGTVRLNGRDRSVHAVPHGAGRIVDAVDRQHGAAVDQPHECRRKQIGRGVFVEIEGCAVREEHFDSAGRRAEPITGHHRSIDGGSLGVAVPFERRRALHVRDVCRFRQARDVLRASEGRSCQHRQGQTDNRKKP